MDRSGVRLELLKLTWRPVGGGSPTDEAIRVAKKLEDYVFGSGVDSPTQADQAVPQKAPSPNGGK